MRDSGGEMVYRLTPRYIQNLYVRVCSRLLDHRDECKRLWYLLRASDEAGAGSAVLSVEHACLMLGCTVQTFYRLLKVGGSWFHGSQPVGNGLLRIYYRSMVKVCVLSSIKQLGAIAWTNQECFTRAGAKAIASELEALHRQQQAVWNAKRFHEPYEVIEPGKKCSSVNSARGKIAFTYGDFVCPGASLQGIATSTNWSPRTHKQRLNNRWRMERGISPVLKARVAHKVGEGARLSDMGVEGECFAIVGDRILRTFPTKSGIYQLCTNIYSSEHGLMSCRFIRSKVAKASLETDALRAQ